MSHSLYDAPGGHRPRYIGLPGRVLTNSGPGRRYAKRFDRRAARRESRRIIRQAIAEHEAEIAAMLDELAALEREYLDDWCPTEWLDPRRSRAPSKTTTTTTGSRHTGIGTEGRAQQPRECAQKETTDA